MFLNGHAVFEPPPLRTHSLAPVGVLEGRRLRDEVAGDVGQPAWRLQASRSKKKTESARTRDGFAHLAYA